MDRKLPKLHSIINSLFKRSKIELLFLLFFMSSIQAFSSIYSFSFNRTGGAVAGAYTSYNFTYAYNGADDVANIFDLNTTSLDFSSASALIWVDGVFMTPSYWSEESGHRFFIRIAPGDYRGKNIYVEINSILNGPAGSGFWGIKTFGNSTGDPGGTHYMQDVIFNMNLPDTYGPAANPGTPTLVNGTKSSSGFQVSWTASASSTYQYAPDNYLVTILNSDNSIAQSEVAIGTAQSYWATGLSPGGTFKVRVRAHNTYGYSGWVYSSNITTLNQVAQTITFNALPAKTYGDADFSPGATASSGLTVTYSSSNTAVATIVSNNIHIVGAGNATIYANQAGNGSYQAAPQKSQTLTIDKKTLSVTGATATKEYDGTTNAIITGGTLNGIINSDAVSITNPASGTYASALPGTDITVTPALTLTGAQAGNYSVTQPALTGTISQRTLTVTGATVANKVYDGNTGATISGATLSGVVGSEDVKLTSATSGVFASKNIGSNISVTTAMEIEGTDISRYTLVQPNLTATITAKELTVSGAVASDKIYDATTVADITGATLVGVVGSEDVTLTNHTTGTFDSPDAASNINVVPAMAIEGTDIGNYTLTQPLLSATINKKELTVTGAATINKVYDSNTNTDFTDATLVGIVGSDEVILQPTGTFANKNIGNGILVTPEMTITGAKAANYKLTQPAGPFSANISPKELTVSNAIAANKIYDGNTNATISGATLIGVIGSEEVTLATATSGTFDSPEVNNAINVTTEMTLEGADIGNYSLTQPTLSANITPKELTVSGAVANTKIYDSTKDGTFSGASLVGVVGEDDVTLHPNGIFADANVNTGITVTPAMTITGAKANNYTLTQPANGTASITAKELTVTGAVAANKIYDGNTAAVISGATLIGVIGSEDVTLTNQTSGTFADKNVADGIGVATTMNIVGAAIENYFLTQPILSANITPKEASITEVVATSKIYDATTIAQLSGGILNGIINPDQVTIVAGNGNFANKSIGTGKAVTATGYSLSGVNAGNYYLSAQPSGMTANITPASLSISGVIAENKVYDATNEAILKGGTLVGILGNDKVNLMPGIGIFSSEDVGTDKKITAVDYGISGIDASNYLPPAQPTELWADITPAKLTITGVFASDKVYDGTTIANLSQGSLQGILLSDQVSLISGTGSFADKNVENAKTVTATGFSIEGPDAGNYFAIEQPSGLSASITPATLNITADDKSKIYGSQNPAFTLTYQGFANGDNENNITPPSVNCQADGTSNPGNYPISLSEGNAPNYTFDFKNGNLKIEKAVLTITAEDKTRIFKSENPELTFTYAGFVNNESSESLQQIPTISTVAGYASLPGEYPIVVSGGISDKYSFAYSGGKLRILAYVGDKNQDGEISDNEIAGDKDGDGKITKPEIAGDTNGDGKIGNNEVAGDKDGDGKITAPELAGDTDGDGKIGNNEIAGDKDGDGKINKPEIAGDTNSDGKIGNNEVAGDKDGDGKITAPELAGDTDGDGKIGNNEIAGDKDGDGKINKPEIAGDTNGDGNISTNEVAGDKDGDGKITAPEIAGDKDGDGKITAPEIAGDKDGDGKITKPEVAGDTNGDGKIGNNEVAGDKDGDGKITAPEIAGDKDGDGKITAQEIAGDKDGDGKITKPEVAGDTNGDGKIDSNEVAGDKDGDGKVTAPELAGDTDGDGKIGNDEFAGDIDGDGKITKPEIAGDTNGDGNISTNEVAGDKDGDGKITAPEIAGDKDGDGKITAPEIAGDKDGDGKITKPEIAGDTNGDGKIDSNEVAGDKDGDGKVTAPELAGDTDGDGKIGNDEFAGDIDGDGKITKPEIAGDTSGDGKIGNNEVAGDKDGDGKITAPELAGDTDGDGKIGNNEIAGDKDGDGKITKPEIAGDTNGDGKIGNNEVAGDKDGDEKITAPELAGDTDGDGKIGNNEIAGDKDGDGKITKPEIAGDTNGDGKIGNNEVAGDKDGDRKITAPELAGDTDGDGKIGNNEIAGDKDGDGKITKPEVAGDTNGDGKIGNNEVAGDKDGDGKITAPELAGDTDADGKIGNNEVAGDKDGDGKITASEIAGDKDGDGNISTNEVAGDKDGDGKIGNNEVAGDTDGDGKITAPEIAGDTDGDGKIDTNEVAGDKDGDGKIGHDEIAGDIDGDGEISSSEIMGDIDGDGKISTGEIAGDKNGDKQIGSSETQVVDPTKDHVNIKHLFSPNGDGINDYWKIPGIEDYGRVQVKVYDRWGSLIYESTSYQNDWDGTFKGKPVPEGAYFYFARSEKKGNQTGVINIVR